MKVLKFGKTSVGKTAEDIQKVRKIIENEAENGSIVVVVDAAENVAETLRMQFAPRIKGNIRLVTGSDYTAAILAAELDAEILEIWTDVDGFMTADPRVIKSAYTISELSYIEAMELCNFGAEVIYPPMIYPVCVKNIPIRVRNTFNLENPGTLIKQQIDNDQKPIKGISSIKNTSLITVTGLSMVGVIGVNRRIFTTLADNGISVFMVSQASSENSTSIGVREEDAEEAARVLNKEFSEEIATGAMPGVGDGQGGPACYDSWGRKESDMTE